MAVRKTDRRGVVEAARALFRSRGYHRTSMSDIGAACGLLKGSVYHHFPGKEALGRAVIEQEAADTGQALFRITREESRPEEERLADFCRAVEELFLNTEGGSLMANLAHDIPGLPAGYAGPVRDYFGDWIEALAGLLERRHGRHRALELATDYTARVFGALMMVRLDRRATAAVHRAHFDLLATLG